MIYRLILSHVQYFYTGNKKINKRTYLLAVGRDGRRSLQGGRQSRTLAGAQGVDVEHVSGLDVFHQVPRWQERVLALNTQQSSCVVSWRLCNHVIKLLHYISFSYSTKASVPQTAFPESGVFAKVLCRILHCTILLNPFFIWISVIRKIC